MRATARRASIRADSAGTPLGGVATVAGAVAVLFALLESGADPATVAVLLMGVPGVVAGSMTTLSVNVATPDAIIEAIEQVIVPLAPTEGVIHDHPPGEEREEKRSGGGRTSVIVTPGASLGPAFETTIVYCSGVPGRVSDGASVFVMPRSTSTADCELAVAESFAGIKSSGEETVAVADSVVPSATDELTWDTTVNVADAARFIVVVREQVTVPLVPTDGVLQDHPAGAPIETKVVGAGNGRVTDAVLPVLGPLFVTVMVQVRFDPAFTGFGAAPSAMLKSD
jgi:hypothetical protein